MKNEREINRELTNKDIASTLNKEQKELILDLLKISRNVLEKTPDIPNRKYHEGFIKFWGFLEDDVDKRV